MAQLILISWTSYFTALGLRPQWWISNSPLSPQAGAWSWWSCHQDQQSQAILTYISTKPCILKEPNKVLHAPWNTSCFEVSISASLPGPCRPPTMFEYFKRWGINHSAGNHPNTGAEGALRCPSMTSSNTGSPGRNIWNACTWKTGTWQKSSHITRQASPFNRQNFFLEQPFRGLWSIQHMRLCLHLNSENRANERPVTFTASCTYKPNISTGQLQPVPAGL